MKGFELNLEPLNDEATATFHVDGKKLDVNIKELWEAISSMEVDIENPGYISSLRDKFSKVAEHEFSNWATEIIYNAVTQWVTGLYKKK